MIEHWDMESPGVSLCVVVEWRCTTLLLSTPFDVVNGMHKDYKKPLIFHTQWAKIPLSTQGETYVDIHEIVNLTFQC